MISWDDLNADEQTALKRRNRGAYPALSPDLAARLISLGLAEERSTGVGINRTGRTLVIDYLIGATRTEVGDEAGASPEHRFW